MAGRRWHCSESRALKCSRPTEQATKGERQDPAQPRCYLGGFLEEVSGANPAHALWVGPLLGLQLPEILISATPGGGSSDFRGVLGAACSLRIKDLVREFHLRTER